MPVVGQDDEAVACDQAVGGIAIDDINLAGVEGLILDGGQEGMHLAEVQVVRRRESRQSVGAADEIRGETGGEAVGYAGEVAQRVQAVACRGPGTDGDGIGVLEAERGQPLDTPAAPELGGDAGEHRRGVCLGRFAQDHEQAGAGVLGVDIDGTGAQGLERNLGCAESGPSRDSDTARLEELGKDLGEQVGLAEGLGGHHHRPGRVLPGREAGRAHERPHGCEQQALHAAWDRWMSCRT